MEDVIYFAHARGTLIRRDVTVAGDYDFFCAKRHGICPLGWAIAVVHEPGDPTENKRSVKDFAKPARQIFGTNVPDRVAVPVAG